MGLLARTFEAAGLPAMTLSSALDITRSVRPPRAAFLNFPLGHTSGKPLDRTGQMALLRDALDVLVEADSPGALVCLDYTWDEPDWEGAYDYHVEV